MLTVPLQTAICCGPTFITVPTAEQSLRIRALHRPMRTARLAGMTATFLAMRLNGGKYEMLLDILLLEKNSPL